MNVRFKEIADIDIFHTIGADVLQIHDSPGARSYHLPSLYLCIQVLVGTGYAECLLDIVAVPCRSFLGRLPHPRNPARSQQGSYYCDPVRGETG